MALAYLKNRSGKAKLPKDFIFLISIKRYDGLYLPMDSFLQLGIINRLGEFKTECFHINGDTIYFQKSYSSLWLIRIFEKLNGFLFPNVYEMEYNNK